LREEQLEKIRLEKERVAKIKEQERIAEEKRLAKEREIQDKINKKNELMEKFKKGSKCVEMGAKFLSALGDQKVENEI